MLTARLNVKLSVSLRTAVKCQAAQPDNHRLHSQQSRSQSVTRQRPGVSAGCPNRDRSKYFLSGAFKQNLRYPTHYFPEFERLDDTLISKL